MVSVMDKPLIPAGYKQTEIGVIPESWSIISIEDAIDRKIILDQMDGNHGELYPKSHEFSDSGIPYIGATDFNNGRVDFGSCKYLPEKRAKLFRKGIAMPGDVLFAHNATVGPVALLSSDFPYVILSTTATYYRCNVAKISNEYLASYFSSASFIGQYSAVMSQSTRNQVPILTQRKFKLIFPSYEEQTAIANALSDVDALIAALEKLINKKSAIKTAAMQQLLTGKKRLPPFDQLNTGYKQTELGEIPVDWEVMPIHELATLKNVRTNPKVSGGGEFCIELEHIDQGVGTLNGNTITTPLSSLKNSFVEGDILFGKLRSYLRKYWMADRCGVCSTEIWVLAANKEKTTSEFLYQTVRTEKFIECTTEAYGTHMPRSDWKIVKEFLLPIPTIAEQTIIGSVLSDMDEELEALQLRLHKTQQIKQGMMQELLTGKTRLVK